VNKTLFLALIGVAAGTAAVMLMPRNARKSLVSDARLALDYATDRLPLAGRSPRRKTVSRSAAKRKLVRKGHKLARAAA